LTSQLSALGGVIGNFRSEYNGAGFFASHAELCSKYIEKLQNALK